MSNHKMYQPTKWIMTGKVISGRYQILQKLGGGGFGETFLAQDLQLPDYPQCVVKRLKPVTDDTNIFQIASRLFETEARVLHHLGSHDRIPRLLAHFHEDKEFYLVQELIRGHELTEELIPQAHSPDGYPLGRMNEAQAIAFLVEVLEILTFVHQQGAIHRDLKPANLMRRDSDHHLVLIDFGAVKQVSSNTTVAATVAIGTDGYMPNEQAIGKPRPCSDLYALGAIAIQGLTGVLPKDIAEDAQTGELAWRESPPHSNIKYLANVSDRLAMVIDKLVKYDFRQRYQSAELALQDLRDLYTSTAPTLVTSHLHFHQQDRQDSQNLQDRQNTYQALPQISNQDARKNWLIIGTVGVASAIAVVSIVINFFPLSPRPNGSTSNITNQNQSSQNQSSQNQSGSNSTLTSPKYLFLSERLISDADLRDKSNFELDLMRNEIFARYGRQFRDPELQSYFNSQAWYQPRYSPEQFPSDLLTPLEIQNVEYIRNFQAKSSSIPIPPTVATNQIPPNSQCDYTHRLVSDPNPPINVRAGAGTNQAIVGTLNNGTKVTVSQEQQGWLQITEPIAGWIAANRTKPICL